MMILRKLKVQSPTIILAEIPAGLKDGTNQIYTVQSIYKAGKIEVIYNGQVLHSPDDFQETGLYEVTLSDIRPDSTDELRITYEVD